MASRLYCAGIGRNASVHRGESLTMKRGLHLLLLVALLATLLPFAAQPVTAQSDDCPTPILTLNRHGVILEGKSVNAYERADGTDLLATLTQGTLFQIVDGPQCVDGVNWWAVADENYAVWGGWIPETANGQPTVEPYVFVPDAPVALGVPMTPPIITTPDVPLPAVPPAARPAALDTSFATWDWNAFTQDNWYQAPDPLALQLPAAYAGDLPALPVNLDDVHFVVDAGLNEAQLRLLAQNGFVVVPGAIDQFDTVYRNQTDQPWDHTRGQADFITSDALFHALYLSYENLQRALEHDLFFGQVANFTGAGALAAQVQWHDAMGTSLEDAALKAAIYYAVPVMLLADAEEAYVIGYDMHSAWQTGDHRPSEVLQAIDPAILDAAQPIVGLIKAGEGRLEVPILENYEEDFSQYQVRSYYAGDPVLEAYFRAVMWLGRITFTLRSQTDTVTGLLVLRALQQADSAYATWEAVTDTLSFLVGPVDDLGPGDYAPIAESIYGAGLPLDALSDPLNLDEFRRETHTLPGPRVNSIVLPVGIEADDVDAYTRGFRLFGQRFTFDGYAMQQLIYPEVGTAENGRALPLGLDVAAVLGSDVAYTLADAAGATAFQGYTDHVAALRNEVDSIDANSWLENFVGGWLWTFQPLLIHDSALLPPMLLTDAWQRKDLQTMLGSWTQLKHATVLYAEQPMGGLGGGGMEPPIRSYGFVEPNPEVFARIAVVAALLHQGLDARGLLTDGMTSSLGDALRHVSVLAAKLAEMARKEIAGEALTHDELYFLQESFADALWSIRYEVEIWITDPPENVAIVTDVASNPAAGTVLLEGIGLVDYIYAIGNGPDGLHLTRGAVYSQYEFVNPIDERLTDDAWRARVASGDLPPRADWIDLFFSE